jgi:hypothetical protein
MKSQRPRYEYVHPICEPKIIFRYFLSLYLRNSFHWNSFHHSHLTSRSCLIGLLQVQHSFNFVVQLVLNLGEH